MTRIHRHEHMTVRPVITKWQSIPGVVLFLSAYSELSEWKVDEDFPIITCHSTIWVEEASLAMPEPCLTPWEQSSSQNKKAQGQSVSIHSPLEVSRDSVLLVTLVSVQWEQKQGLLRGMLRPEHTKTQELELCLARKRGARKFESRG